MNLEDVKVYKDLKSLSGIKAIEIANFFKVERTIIIYLIQNNFQPDLNISNILNSEKDSEKLLKTLSELKISKKVKKPKVQEVPVIKNKVDKIKTEYVSYDLVGSLYELRTDFCGIGTNKVKRRLNKLAENDDLALAIRKAIEIEDKNIQAKKYWRDYYNNYDDKHLIIHELIEIFIKNGWNYGKEVSDAIGIPWVIFFELPDCEQISWHTNLDHSNDVPDYCNVWDGKINSTLYKLQDLVKLKYSKIIY